MPALLALSGTPEGLPPDQPVIVGDTQEDVALVATDTSAQASGALDTLPPPNPLFFNVQTDLIESEDHYKGLKRTNVEWERRAEILNNLTDEQRLARQQKFAEIIAKGPVDEHSLPIICYYPEYANALIEGDSLLPPANPITAEYLAWVHNYATSQAGISFGSRIRSIDEDSIDENYNIPVFVGGYDYFGERYGSTPLGSANERIDQLLDSLFPEGIDTQDPDKYVDIILSRTSTDMGGVTALATLVKFPDMSSDRYEYLLAQVVDDISEGSIPTPAAFQALSLKLTNDQQEKVGATIMQYGTDIEVYYFQKNHRDLHGRLQEQGIRPNKDGYLATFGEQVTLDKLETLPESAAVHVVVHPFFEGSEFYPFGNEFNTVEEFIIHQLRSSYFAGYDAFQEYEELKDAMTKGNPIILVLPKFELKHPYATGYNTYAKMLKQVLGDYPNLYILESATRYSGDMADYYSDDLDRIGSFGDRAEFTYSGGYVGKCLYVTRRDLTAYGIIGDVDPEAISLDVASLILGEPPEHDIARSLRDQLEGVSAPEGGFDPTYEGMKSFFDQYPELNAGYNAGVFELMESQP